MAKAKAKPNKNAILLSDVETLTLRGHGAKTTNRRVSAIPQLKCKSHPSLCRLVEDKLDLMRCTNQGSSYDDADVEWTCAATLPEEVRLGTTDVICEGYSSSDDPYVLKGSCGVEYTVALTPKGERRYPHLETQGASSRDWSAIGFMVLFVGVLVWIVYSAWIRYQENNGRRPANRRAPRGGGGWGGGGGGGGGPGWDPRFGGPGDDPPPPYPGRKPSSSNQQAGWRPGFWSGLAGGAAAGYAAGNMGRNRGNRRDDYYYDSPSPAPRRGGSSSYSSSNAGPSGTSHESTGFGSTSRR